mmetsp:Transcript_24175/g.81266  ORF Transcript_24175/g.81266 Transcript_24175/m.81266 type:complete len:374 (-) Transcript_24175:307-1428(-)
MRPVPEDVSPARPGTGLKGAPGAPSGGLKGTAMLSARPREVRAARARSERAASRTASPGSRGRRASRPGPAVQAPSSPPASRSPCGPQARSRPRSVTTAVHAAPAVREATCSPSASGARAAGRGRASSTRDAAVSCPSCPRVLSPHSSTRPLLIKAAEWSDPAATATGYSPSANGSAMACGAARRPAASPSETMRAASPRTTTVPEASTANVTRGPACTAVTASAPAPAGSAAPTGSSAGPSTSSARAGSAPSWAPSGPSPSAPSAAGRKPSWPKWLAPHPRSLPWSVRTTVWPLPAAAATGRSPGRSSSSRGTKPGTSLRSAASSSAPSAPSSGSSGSQPNCRSPLSPQVHTRPSAVTPTPCASPAAAAANW